MSLGTLRAIRDAGFILLGISIGSEVFPPTVINAMEHRKSSHWFTRHCMPMARICSDTIGKARFSRLSEVWLSGLYKLLSI